MIYLFKCTSKLCPARDISFDEEQAMLDNHIAYCSECGLPAQRIYTDIPHTWEPYANPKYNRKEQ